jgi:hypothetical protein
MNDENRHFVQVRVVTTSGSFPKHGYERAPINQPVKVILQHAAKALEIVDTAGWVARVEDREIDPNRNYQDNNLSGKIVIDYGPREGGGGHA